MAVQIFKDGKCTYIEPDSLLHHLNAGWSLEDTSAPTTGHIAVAMYDAFKEIFSEDEQPISLEVLAADNHPVESALEESSTQDKEDEGLENQETSVDAPSDSADVLEPEGQAAGNGEPAALPETIARKRGRPSIKK